MLHKLLCEGIGLQRNYEVVLGDRLTIFTGDNGLGKTFVLDIAWWCLTQTWRHSFAFPNIKNPPNTPFIEGYFTDSRAENIQVFRSEYSYDHQLWSAIGQSPNQSVVIYIGADNSIAVWDPLRNIYPSQKFAWDSEEDNRPYNYIFKNQDEIWYGLNSDSKTVTCNGLIRDWNTWQMAEEFLKRKHNIPSEFSVLRRILEKLSCPGEELKPGQPVRPYVLNALDFPSLDCPYGTVPIQYASSGVKRILELAYIITWAWHEHTMAALVRRREPAKKITIIIDEIESHLFPKWQRNILPALIEVTKFLGLESQILMTTHSPLIMASTEEFLNEDTDKILLFEQKDNEVTLEPFVGSLKGTCDNWLTSEIFNLKEPRGKKAEEAIREAENLMEERSRDNLQLIDARLRELLPATDLFWYSWHRYLLSTGSVND